MSWRQHGLEEARRYAALVGAREDDVLLDIGANCGEVSRLWRGRRARAVAVEPNLLLHGQLRSISELVCIEAAVVGELAVETVLFMEAARDVCSYIDVAYVGERPPDEIVRAYSVHAVRFRDLVETYRPSVIKVDVEGSEYLFADDFVDLPEHVRALAVEWHGFGVQHCARAHVYDHLLVEHGWTAVGDELPATFIAAVRGYLRT